jgi:peptidoglycan/LPS O-acetylase OafA/YrhL
MELTTPPANRSAPLDALRALAIALVLGRHLPELPAGCAPAWLLGAVACWQRAGWIGVDLFFVLSGFLVSGLLFREYRRFGEFSAGRFLARRAFKIYPAFYLMFAFVMLFAAHAGRSFVGWPVVLSEVFFVQNYGPSLFPHTWSLAVEEHFYLLLPLLLFALRGKKDAPFARLPAVVIGVAALALAGRVWNAQLFDFRLKTHLFPTHLRVDSLLIGVLLSWLAQFHPEPTWRFFTRHRAPLAAAAFALVLPAFFAEVGSGWYLHTLGLTGLALASGVLLLFALRWKSAWRPVAFLGAHSYSIYLWHIPIRFFGPAFLPREMAPLAQAAAYLALSAVGGIVAAKLIESPFLAMRDRCFPTRSRANVAANDAREVAPAEACAA